MSDLQRAGHTPAPQQSLSGISRRTSQDIEEDNRPRGTQVKVALLKEDKERLEQLNDEMRRARVLNDLPKRTGLSGETPTILNTNNVSVGCCSKKGRCEERSRTQVIRGTTVVGDTADGGPQDEGSVIIEDVPDDAEAGPEVTGAHRSSPEPTQ